MSEEEMVKKEDEAEEEAEEVEELKPVSVIPEDVEIREERLYTVPLWKSWVRKRGYRRAKRNFKEAERDF